MPKPRELKGFQSLLGHGPAAMQLVVTVITVLRCDARTCDNVHVFFEPMPEQRHKEKDKETRVPALLSPFPVHPLLSRGDDTSLLRGVTTEAEELHPQKAQGSNADMLPQFYVRSSCLETRRQHASDMSRAPAMQPCSISGCSSALADAKLWGPMASASTCSPEHDTSCCLLKSRFRTLLRLLMAAPLVGRRACSAAMPKQSVLARPARPSTHLRGHP